jgi:NAD(P)H-flavin reductase
MAVATEQTGASLTALPAPFTVRRRHRETPDTWTLELEAPPGEELTYGPGQFTMLYAFGIGEVPVSISGDPAAGGPLTQTVRAVGRITEAICASRPGDAIGVRGPFGTSWPVEAARGQDVLIVAGGIGLAPLRPALYAVLADRAAFGSVSLLYGSRTPDELLFRQELERWRGRLDLDVGVTVDAGTGDWRGSVGLVTKLIGRASFDPAATVAFVCGPEIMMRVTARALVEQGVAPDSVYISMERNMRCAVAHCGHCQYGPTLICRDGAVYRYDTLAPLLEVREL